MAAQKFVLALILFLLVTLLPVYISGDSSKRLIVWNVGQGQWVTLVRGGECWHFDTGGEFAPWEAIIRICGERLNRIFLSHWDSDHIGFANQLARKLPACLQSEPPGPAPVQKARRILQIPRCAPMSEGLLNWRPSTGHASNDWSQIFSVENVLLPGDSTRGQEKFWEKALPDLWRVRILLLGHHGSRTSTSIGLLQELRGLKMAVASARFRRYGHPHMETLELLQRFRVPLLRTEDWGTIVFEI